MDVLACVTAVASCVTAIATAVTVIVAIKQFSTTLSKSEKQRKEDRRLLFEDNASLVDIWIALKRNSESNEHFIVIENNSDSSIRNLEINCIWNNKEIQCENSFILLDFLPKGIWLISRNYTESYKWNFPVAITRSMLSEEYEPRFRNNEDHVITSYVFCDAHENKWKHDCISQTTQIVDH